MSQITHIALTSTTERFTAILVLLAAILSLLGLVGKAALHMIHSIDALLTELHENTRAINEVRKRIEQ